MVPQESRLSKPGGRRTRLGCQSRGCEERCGGRVSLRRASPDRSTIGAWECHCRGTDTGSTVLLLAAPSSELAMRSAVFAEAHPIPRAMFCECAALDLNDHPQAAAKYKASWRAAVVTNSPQKTRCRRRWPWWSRWTYLCGTKAGRRGIAAPLEIGHPGPPSACP